MASLNISKRLRKSAYDASDDDISQNGSNSSYLDSEDDRDYQPEVKRQRSISNVSNIQRRPTRVPDPKVKNRNALLARENRQRKKEMMGNMEQQVEELTMKDKENQKKIKLLKENNFKKDEEIRYLRCVLSNQPGISQLLKKFGNVNQSIKPSTQGSTYTSSAGSETASVTSEHNGKCNKNTNIFEDPFLNDVTLADFNEDDVLNGIFNNPFEGVEEIKVVDDFLPSVLTPPGSTRSNNDHDYIATSKTSKMSTPGICFHINDGQFSLEFCAQCHKNAISSWTESY